jgi:serine/threonine-protein kinase RsbW
LQQLSAFYTIAEDPSLPMSRRIIHIRNNTAELERANREIGRYLESEGFAHHLIQSVTLGLEEVVTNIIKYGYDDLEEHQIEITLQLTDSRLRLLTVDDGHEFNPLDHPQPDLAKSLDDREPGGLGIFFLSKLFDNIQYRRENGRNSLTLVKVIPRPLSGKKYDGIDPSLERESKPPM